MAAEPSLPNRATGSARAAGTASTAGSTGGASAADPTAAPPLARLERPGRTAAWLAKQVEVGLAELGLTLPQYRVLGLLDTGPAMSSAIARHLAVRPPSVTGVVDGLVARGLVARTNDEEDRRCVSLDLTEEGRRLLDGADEAVEARLQLVLSGLRTSGERTRALGDLTLWHQAMAAHRETLAATKAEKAAEKVGTAEKVGDDKLKAEKVKR